MVVTIKEHRYDVDFDDVRVIAAADDGKRAIVEASTASAAETRAASAELVHRATACVTASKASGRQPVRLE